jgi:hypothetical protein
VVNLLFVSISFPPKSDAECLQTAKYFTYLRQQEDLRIEVVTSAIPTLYMTYDKMLEPYAKGYNNLVEVKLKENRWLNLFRSRFGFMETVFPDTKQSFHLQFKSVLKKIKNKPDVIYSRSYPLSSAMMAYKLKQEFKVPWIFHLSDPWADTPLHNWSKKYNKKHHDWEFRCIEAANIVCLTSQRTIHFYRKKYPQFNNKFLFFPNVYELNTDQTSQELKDPHPFIQRGKLNIVFTGAMAADRSPSFFLEPLRELIEEDPHAAEWLNIIFAGEADFKNRTVFEQYKMSCVHYLGKISYNDAKHLQQGAQLLLVIDNPIENPELAMFFPSKLLDYMVAKKRVLAITTKGSASEDVIKDLKGEIYGHKQLIEIKQSIQNAIAQFQAGNMAYFQSPDPPLKYEAKYNAERLGSLIKELVND